MPDFIAQHWPARFSDASERRYKTIKQRMDLNRRRIAGEPVGPDPDPDPDNGGRGDPEGEGGLASSALFAIEAHLRDFIAGNLARVPLADRRLSLFKNSSGRGGVEYPTAVGPIDILTTDQDGNFFVFELKLARGPDKALGQLARYMGWVKVHLAAGKNVTGVIVANSIDEKLRYAASVFPGVILLEYALAFSIRGITAMDGSGATSA